jgi:putative DNA primase/helicase
MELNEVKQLIDTYHSAGKNREDTASIVSALPINGEEVEAFEYIEFRYQSTSEKELTLYNLTDAGNAEYFTDLYGNKLHYDHRRSHWLEWHEHYWRPENDVHIIRLALKAARTRYKAAVNIENLKLRDKISSWAIQSEQRSRLEACTAIAKNLKPIADSGDHWDADNWLFCVANGVIDLRTGELRPGKTDDMITLQSPVIFDKDAKCTLWHKFIDQITNGDVELQRYLQRAVGYSLTGETKAQLWFFLYGLGSNGKTTFTMIIRRLMGDYGVRLDSDDLMIKQKKGKGSSPKEGIADTRGKRYAIASEVQDGKQLDIGLLKDMSGQDTIKARRLYEHEIEFLPTHKTWMFGNHKPVIKDTTHAAWRRLKLIPFTYTVPENELDLDLQAKLEGELSGILNWAIEGCLQWQREGFNEPNVVTDAVLEYRHESDILADFIEDTCILEHLVTVVKSDLKETYENWCKENRCDPVTQKTFKDRLTEKGIREGRSGKVRFWIGIRLKNDTDIDENINDKSDKNDKTHSQSSLKVTRDNEIHKSPHTRKENEILCEKPLALVTLDTNDDIPPFPTRPCRNCGGDYYLSDFKQWLCNNCYPKPGRKV